MTMTRYNIARRHHEFNRFDARSFRDIDPSVLRSRRSRSIDKAKRTRTEKGSSKLSTYPVFPVLVTWTAWRWIAGIGPDARFSRNYLDARRRQ